MRPSGSPSCANNRLKNRRTLARAPVDARREIIAATAVAGETTSRRLAAFPRSAGSLRPAVRQWRLARGCASSRRSRSPISPALKKTGMRGAVATGSNERPTAGDLAVVVDIAHDQLDRAERDAVGIFGAAAEPRSHQRADRQLLLGFAQAGRIGGFEVGRRPCRDRRRRRRRNRRPPDRPRCGWRTAGRAGADSGPARRCRRDRRPSGGPCPGTASSDRRARPAKAAPSAECARRAPPGCRPRRYRRAVRDAPSPAVRARPSRSGPMRAGTMRPSRRASGRPSSPARPATPAR